MPEDTSVTKFEYSSESIQKEQDKFENNDNNNISQEKLDRLNAKEDPNVSSV